MTLRSYLERDDLPGCRAEASLLAWLATQAPDATADAIVAACPRGDWLVWLYRRVGVPAERLSAAVRPAALRAAREYAPAALDAAVAAGCTSLAPYAAALRALPDDAHNAAIARIADAAAWMADAARAARAARAAEAAMWAAVTPAWSAAWSAARAADATAEHTATHEHALCADDVRREIPWSDVAPLFAAALGEVAP